MNTTGKVIVGILVLLVVLGGVYYAVKHNNSKVTQTPQTLDLPGGESNSDEALQQDTATIDTQLNALSSDTAEVHQSLNDQPLAQ